MPYAITGYYGQGNGGSGVTVHDGPTFTAVAGEAAIALLYWGAGSAATVTSFTDAVGTNDGWVQMTPGADPSSQHHMRAFHIENMAAGVTTPRVTWNSGTNSARIAIITVSGLAASAFDQSMWGLIGNPTTATDGVAGALSTTLLAQPAMVLGWAWMYNTSFTQVATPGTGMTAVGDDGLRSSVAHKRVTATTATRATFTSTPAGNLGHMIASFATDDRPTRWQGDRFHEPSLRIQDTPP